MDSPSPSPSLIIEEARAILARIRPPATLEHRANLLAYANAYADAHGWPRIAWQMALINGATAPKLRARSVR